MWLIQTERPHLKLLTIKRLKTFTMLRSRTILEDINQTLIFKSKTYTSRTISPPCTLEIKQKRKFIITSTPREKSSNKKTKGKINCDIYLTNPRTYGWAPHSKGWIKCNMDVNLAKKVFGV